ncbi:MAG: hypothetical protein RL651_372 [Pseudomonadota bacterium]|jgi:hypothetical protein
MNTQQHQSNLFGRMCTIAVTSAAALALVACGGGGLTQSQKSGFLTSTEYNRLAEVDSPAPGVKVYRYISPNFNRSDWKGVMIDPVILFQTALKNEGKKGLSEETIYQTRMLIDSELKEKAAKRFNVVDKPGPGIARLSVAITGAEIEGDGFKPWNVIPVSAVLFAAQKATGVDSKTPSLVVEAKMRDSVSGKILGEGVYVMSGETFRMESSSPEAFQKLAINWVTTAVRVAAGMAGN